MFSQRNGKHQNEPNYRSSPLWNESHAVVTTRAVGGSVAVEIIGDGVAAARDDDKWTQVDEVGCVRAVHSPGIHLHDVGPAAGGGPRDQDIGALRRHGDDVEGRGAI